jgi:hypothetical protein
MGFREATAQRWYPFQLDLIVGRMRFAWSPGAAARRYGTLLMMGGVQVALRMDGNYSFLRKCALAEAVAML